MVTTASQDSVSLNQQYLSSITNIVDFRTTVSYLPDRMGLDIRLFYSLELSKQFYIDTIHCVTKRKAFNRNCLYDTFAEYTNLRADEVKARLIHELSDKQEWYEQSGIACLGMQGIKYDKWLKKLKLKRSWPEELALYGLCILFCQNALVINSGRPWTTLEHMENLTQGVFTEVCETILLYLGNNLYAVSRHLPFSLDQPSPTDLEDIHQMWPLTITSSPE